MGIRKAILPKMKPLDAITWCAKRALDENYRPNFLFFENLSSYGSGAVGVINELAKQDGVIVFGSRMDRKKKSFEIAFNSTNSDRHLRKDSKFKKLTLPREDVANIKI